MNSKLLQEFYEKYSREIYLYVYSLSHDRFLSEDLMQETFVKALLSLPEQHTNVRAWLYMVARNLYFNHERNHRHEEDKARQQERSRETEITDPVGRLLQSERDKILFAAVNRLQGRKREVVLLQYFSEMPQKEIARVLGITMENVRVLSFRAKKELKQWIKEAGYDI